MANGKLNLGKQSGGVLSISFPDGATNTEVVLPESGNLVSVDTAVTDNAIARYDGTTGKLQNSGVKIDDNGNIGIGVTPSAWVGCYPIQLGNSGGIYGFSNSNTLGISANSTWNGTNDIYRYSGNAASKYSQSAGAHYWQTAPSGTAGNAIAWSNAMSLDANGNLLLTSGTGALGYGTGAGGVVTQLTSKSTMVTLNKPNGRIIMHNAALAAGASVDFTLLTSLVVGNDTTATVCLVGGVSNVRNYIVDLLSSSGGLTIKVTNISSGSLSEAGVLHYTIIKGATA